MTRRCGPARAAICPLGPTSTASLRIGVAATLSAAGTFRPQCFAIADDRSSTFGVGDAVIPTEPEHPAVRRPRDRADRSRRSRTKPQVGGCRLTSFKSATYAAGLWEEGRDARSDGPRRRGKRAGQPDAGGLGPPRSARVISLDHGWGGGFVRAVRRTDPHPVTFPPPERRPPACAGIGRHAARGRGRRLGSGVACPGCGRHGDRARPDLRARALRRPVADPGRRLQAAAPASGTGQPQDRRPMPSMPRPSPARQGGPT